MTQNETGTDTPAAAIETPQLDTPTPEATADTTTATPEVAEVSEVDEILSDLGRVQKSDDATEGDDPAGDDEDKWPDPEKDPQGYRNEWLKRSNALADREKAIADREAALTTSPAPAPATTPEAPAPKADPAPDAPKPFAETWQEIKARMEDAWENQDNGPGLPKGYEAAGERQVVEFMDKVVLPEMSRMSAYIERQEAREVQQLGERIAQTGLTASEQLKAAYGGEIAPQDVLGAVQNGGLQGYAALRGLRPDQVDLTPEVMVEIYELKHRSTLGDKKPAAAPEPKKTLPDLHRGDGGRNRTEPMTEREEILADMRSSQAVANSR